MLRSTSNRRIGFTTLVVALALTSASLAADSKSKSDPPAKPPVGLPPVVVNVRLTAGEYIPMGAGLAGGLNHGNTSSPNRDKHTLTIELFNRMGQPLTDVEVRYKLYKVITTYETHPIRRNGVYTFRRTSHESPPRLMNEGRETVALRVGERKNVTVHASLHAEELNSRPVYNRRGIVIGYDNVRREDIYGYIVEVIHNGQMIVERLSPSSIRADAKSKSPTHGRRTMIASTLKLTLTAVATLTFAASVWAQQPQVPGVPPQAQAAPKKNPFLMDVKIGSSAYVPMGATRVSPPPATAQNNTDPIILSIAMRNMTAQELKNVKIEAVLYKTNTQGRITETGKVRETLDFNRGEQKVVYANGSLARINDGRIVRYGNWQRTTNPDRPTEEVYGWYVVVYLDNEKIYEKADPGTLVGSEEVKKSLPVAQPPRRR
jgi:hypothetical protein